MTDTRSENIVTDEEIERVHGHARFGGKSKRRVVDEAILQAAFGYSSGSTATSILVEHGLIRKPRRSSDLSTLTKKGAGYLRAMKGSHRIGEILNMMLEGDASWQTRSSGSLLLTEPRISTPPSSPREKRDTTLE